MTKTMECSRRHGPLFDRRYEPAGLKPLPASLGKPGAAELDWRDFHGRFFLETRRHDFDALAEYASYRDSAGKPGGDSTSSGLPVWDWEGGAIA